MTQLTYTIDINAPRQKVWDTMLQDATYRQWTVAFHEGSYYQGSWDEGADIRFLTDDGGKSGMFGRIAANRPYEFVSIEQLGEIVDGQLDQSSTPAWAGSHENYSFSEVDGVTTLRVDLDGEGINDEIQQMFNGMWPPALQKLKEMCEAA